MRTADVVYAPAGVRRGPSGPWGRRRWGWLLLRHRTAAALQALGCLAACLVGLAGLPAVLWWLQDLLWTQTDWRAVVAEPRTAVTMLYLLVGFGWAGWLWLVVATVHDVSAAVRHRPLRPRLPTALGGLVGSLAGIVAVLGQPSLAAASSTPATTPAVTGPSPSGWAHTAPAVIVTPAQVTPASTLDTASTVTPIATGQQVSYQVRRGDWLGAISARYLGDFNRYPQLQRLNPNLMPDSSGRRGPDHIEPGWHLVLPADAVDRGPRQHATGTDTTSTGTTGTTGSGETVTTAPPPTTAPTTVTTPPPTGMPQPPAAVASATPTPGTVSPGRADNQHRDGVTLPGGWISVPFAAALAGAGALVWLRRRHRYVANPDTAAPLYTHPDLRPLPPVLHRIHRALRHQRPDLLHPPPAPPATVAVYTAVDPGSRPPLPPVGPSGPHLAGVGDVPGSGLGLIGPGAEPAARALLVATLSAGTPADPDAEGQIIAPTATLTTLLGADAVHAGQIPRLQATTDLSEALTRIDALLIERQRLLDDHDAADLADLRAADPYHPPMPPVLLLATAPPADDRVRLATTLRLGAALQISAVLLGDGPGGDTLTVDADGHASNGHQLAVLDIPTTRHLLDVLCEAHTGQPPTPQPPPATGATAPTTPTSPDSPQNPPRAAPSVPATPPTAAESGGGEAPLEGPAPTQLAATDAEASPDPAPNAAQAAPTPAAHQPRAAVRIRLLGEPAIVDRTGAPITGLRHHARELLVYLAVHRNGADLSDIMEAFWPTATVRRASERLSTEVGDLRRRIRQAAADTTIQPVINTGGRYHLDPNLLDLDLWQVIDLLRQTSTVTDPHHRAALLRQAVDAHTGPLAQGHDYDWIEQPREHLRRHGIHARRALADLIAADNPRGAADLLQAATDLDPINEDIARHTMRAYARLGDTAAIRAVLHQLRTALNDIDEPPSPDTIALAAQLQRDLTSTNPPDHRPDAGVTTQEPA
ncbi:BTAD domain-containing putative transcriptional regulator [Dactylosporangium sp. NPDC049140]|uniref:BTAD domain-containing putative transcriptional regulator n=1 Tax=Dactylosporangium sp. NPDC049140 TaxID=3155647 RepID=UPI00340503AC